MEPLILTRRRGGLKTGKVRNLMRFGKLQINALREENQRNKICTVRHTDFAAICYTGEEHSKIFPLVALIFLLFHFFSVK